MEIYFVDKVQMNLNKGCIEIRKHRRNLPKRRPMNLNKGCIEIKEPASSAGSVKDEP